MYMAILTHHNAFDIIFIRVTTIESKSNHLAHGYFYIEYLYE